MQNKPDSRKQPEAAIPPEMQRIGFLRRYWALAIDHSMIVLGGMIIALIFEPLFMNLIPAVFGRSLDMDADLQYYGPLYEDVVKTIAIFIITSMLVGLVYNITEIVNRASPGKMILNIEIRHASGEQARKMELFLRYLMKNIAPVGTFFAVVTGVTTFNSIGGFFGFIIMCGCLMIFGKKRQTLYDLIADTAVFPKPKKDDDSDFSDPGPGQIMSKYFGKTDHSRQQAEQP